MVHQKHVVPREYGKMITRLAPLSIISGIYAFLMGHGYDIAIVPLSVGCTTYIYWYNPTYSWRRKLDICTVIVMCFYQAYRAFGAEYAYYYYTCHLLGIISYILGIYYKHKMYIGLLLHTGIHILPNIGNMILYSGRIL